MTETTPETTTTEIPVYSLHRPEFTIEGPSAIMTIFGHLSGVPCDGEDADAVASFRFPSMGVGALVLELLDTLKELDPFSRMVATQMIAAGLAEMDSPEPDSNDVSSMVAPASGLGGLLAALGIPLPDMDEPGDGFGPALDVHPTNEAKGDGTPGMYL